MGTVFMDASTNSATLDVGEGEVVTLAMVPGAGNIYPQGASCAVYWRTAAGSLGAHIGSMSPYGPEGTGVIDAPGTYLVERVPGAYTIERS